MSLKELNTSLSTAYQTGKVGEVLDRKKSWRIQPSAIFRAAVFGAISCFLFVDMYEAYMETQKPGWMIWLTVETIFAILTLLYSLSEVFWLANDVYFGNYTEITKEEQKLLGIKDNDIRFRISPRKQSTPQAKLSPTPKYSSSSFANLQYSPGRSPNAASFRGGSNSNLHSTSLPVIAGSYLDEENKRSHNMSLNQSDASFTLPPVRSPIRGSSIEKRRFNRSFGGGQEIQTIADLETFINVEERKDQTELLMRGEMLPANPNNSFWNTNRSVMDYVGILRKLQYQLSPKHSKLKSSRNENDDQPHKYSAQQTFVKLNIDEYKLDIWIENIRYWIGQTVVQKLSQEIKRVNRELRRLGSDEIQIGETSMSTLKTIALTKSSTIPTLNSLIPYLEVTTHQKYLIQRIHALGNDGCIAVFNWDGGDTYGDKQWDDDLPTDSTIIMHMMCTYLDGKLPHNPRYPDGKTFTTQHFLQTPDKPNFSVKKNYMNIYQTKVNPPHYKLVIDDDIYDITHGRNNMFLSILFFFHYIQQKESSLLGHVSIGASGLNIEWVLTHRFR